MAVAAQYGGPSAWNDAASRFPHILPSTWRYFTPVNPEHVLDEPLDYAQSVFFIPMFMFLVFLFFAIGCWVSECYRCDCCSGERKRCECSCCPERCCTPLTLNHSNPQADVIAPVTVFGFLGVGLLVATFGFQIIGAQRADDVITILRRLQDIQNTNTAALSKAEAQMEYNGALLTTLLNNATSAGVPAPQLLLIEDALKRYVQPAADQLNEALREASVNLDITGPADTAHFYVQWIMIVAIIYFVIMIVFETGGYIAAFLPYRPVLGVIAAVASVEAVFLLLLGCFLVAAGVGGLTIFGDFCQEPLQYIAQRNNNTVDSSLIAYYLECPPGAVNPNLIYLQQAFNATESALDNVQQVQTYFYENGTYPALLNQTYPIISGLQLSLAQIDALMLQSSCVPQHNLLIQALDIMCGSAFWPSFLWIWMLAPSLIFLLCKDCVLPRAEDRGYSAVAARGGATGQRRRTTARPLLQPPGLVADTP